MNSVEVIKLNEYRLLFTRADITLIFASRKPPHRKAVEQATLVLCPGEYPKPRKDRFGLFDPNFIFDELPDHFEMQSVMNRIIDGLIRSM